MPPKPPPAEPQWPPRSPHEALLSTPSGRERFRRMAEQKSPSPSPSRARVLRAAGTPPVSMSAYLSDDLDEMDDDDDDEETLQLKLQAIHAKLKLKKIRAAKAQQKAVTGLGAESDLLTRPDSAPLGRQSRPQSRIAASTTEPFQLPKSQNAIEVPASPVRRAAQPTEGLQRSPSRILLGIDKGLKGKDISLKRAPSLRRAKEGRDAQQFGGYLPSSKTEGSLASENPRPLSFNERLASARAEEVSKQEKKERIQKIRTTAFAVGREEMEGYKAKAVDILDIPTKAPAYSREEILGGASRPKSGGFLQHSSTAPSIRPGSRLDRASQEPPEPPPHSRTITEDADEEASFETYSSLHLSKRILPHPVVTRAVSGKKSYMLRDLLRDVKAPDFSLPDDECDVVVFAIVASKSEPRSHKPVLDSSGNPKPQPDRGKYMVITLVDLTHELELFLFKTGFERYWKISTGTVVAILNPNIMPPPPGREDTGRWSLVINSDADTILEIGTARDLGYCRSVKKDGQLCKSWINAKRTEYCEFHSNEAINRARKGRNEVNVAGFVGGGSGSGGYRKKMSREYNRETQSRWFMSGSAAALLDREDGGYANQVERQEGTKRRVAAHERESEIRRRLGELGAGAGRDYMRHTAAAQPSGSTTSGTLGSSLSSTTLSTLSSSNNKPEPPRSAAAALLGIVSGSRGGEHVRLSPVKRKRPESSQSSSTTGRGGGEAGKDKSGGLGWGSALKDRLARMKEGENLKPAAPLPSASAGDRSPVRKKTRFVTEKGIREAGRESLGAELSAKRQTQVAPMPDDDDDDELVII